MPIPAGITPITVTGTYLAPDGEPLAGYVVFTPSINAADSTDNAIVPAVPYKVTLDEDGQLSVPLAATDDPQWNEPGWTYRVTEVITGDDGQPHKTTYNIAVPTASAGGALDLADALVVDLPGTPSQYLLKAGGTMTGDITLASGVKIVVGGGSGSLLSGTNKSDLTLNSSFAGGENDSDSTGRITLASHQRWQLHNEDDDPEEAHYGELIRLDLMRDNAKAVIAWRDRFTDPDNPYTVIALVAHMEPNDPGDPHGHLGVERKFADGTVNTIMEWRFIDDDGVIGVDRGLIKVNSSDFVVACDAGAFHVTNAAGGTKNIHFGNNSTTDILDGRRWGLQADATAESGSNVGTDFRINNYSDTGVFIATPLFIKRSSGDVGIATVTPAAKFHVNGTAIAQTRLTVGSGTLAASNRLYVEDTTATTQSVLLKATAAGTASSAVLGIETSDNTKRGLDIRVTGDALSRLKFDYSAGSGNGTISFGDGTANDTNLYRSAANSLATDDDFLVNAAGKGIRIKEGSNAKMGTSTLVAGTVTVANTSVTANSRIMLTAQSLGTVAAPKSLAVTARVNATSFTITSSDNTDTSVVAWHIIEPA